MSEWKVFDMGDDKFWWVARSKGEAVESICAELSLELDDPMAEVYRGSATQLSESDLEGFMYYSNPDDYLDKGDPYKYAITFKAQLMKIQDDLTAPEMFATNLD